jgi:hypothetical protein
LAFWKACLTDFLTIDLEYEITGEVQVEPTLALANLASLILFHE